jgi:hypothetical protein
MTGRNAPEMTPACTSAFLLFSNNVVPRRRGVYEEWHGAHHVPQRLTVPGITRAVRYKAMTSGSPEYLTLYQLSHITVLDSPSYRDLVEHPDQITQAMRPHIKDPIRLACHTLWHHGMPDGPFLVACTLRNNTADALAEAIADDLSDTGLPFLAGQTDPQAGGHPAFQQPEDSAVFCFVVSCDDRHRLEAVRNRLGEKADVFPMPVMQRMDRTFS